MDQIDLRHVYTKPFSDAYLRALCIYYDKSPVNFGIYYQAITSLTADVEGTLTDSARGFNKLVTPYWIYPSWRNSYYNINDPILVNQTTIGLTYAPFPTLEPSGECNFDTPGLFKLVNQSITCYVPITTTNCMKSLNYSRILTMQFYSGPDLATLITPTYSYKSNATLQDLTPSILTTNCGSGDRIKSVFLYDNFLGDLYFLSCKHQLYNNSCQY